MCLKNAILSNIQIPCICNAELILTKPYIVYRAAAKCDICEVNIMDFDILFHCPKEKSIDHTMGYDVCLDCAIGNKQNHLSFEKHANKKFKKLDRYQKVIKPEIMMMFEKRKKSIRKKADTITSTIPYIMDIQQMVFKEIMNRINGLDKYQQPGINAHDNIDKRSIVNFAGLINWNKFQTVDEITELYSVLRRATESLFREYKYAYRVLREDENIEDGIYSRIISDKFNEYDKRSISQHVSSGSRKPSSWISTTVKQHVYHRWALFEDGSRRKEWKRRNKPLRVIRIDLQKIQESPSYKQEIINMNDAEVRKYLKIGAIAGNFCKSSGEVLFRYWIPFECYKIIKINKELTQQAIRKQYGW